MSGLPDTRDYKITDTTGEYMRLVLKISKEVADKQRAKDERRERDLIEFKKEQSTTIGSASIQSIFSSARDS